MFCKDLCWTLFSCQSIGYPHTLRQHASLHHGHFSTALLSLTSMNMTPKSLLPSSVLRVSQVSAPPFWLPPRFLQQVAPLNLKFAKSTVEMVIFPTQRSSSVLLMLKTFLVIWVLNLSLSSLSRSSRSQSLANFISVIWLSFQQSPPFPFLTPFPFP